MGNLKMTYLDILIFWFFFIKEKEQEKKWKNAA